MKTFKFIDVDYKDLNELGNAFIDNYAKALEAIQTKEFISFIKSDKKNNKELLDAFYESKTLQSVLAIIIFKYTNKLIIGGKHYENIDQLISDLDSNDCVRPFIEDKGLRKTILSTIEDEVFKINLMSVEDNYFDEFSYKYLKNYKDADPNVTIEEIYDALNSKEKFHSIYKLFKDENFLLKLTFKYNLFEVMKIRRAVTPVFDGLNLIKNNSNETKIIDLLDEAFYYGLGKNYNKFKYKSLRALELLDEIIKKYKKVRKSNDLMVHKDFYFAYLKFVELYTKGEILIKKKYKDYDLNIPYCDTYINNDMLVKYGINKVNEVKEEVDVPCYNLQKISKTIKQHKSYVKWNIAFVVIALAIYGLSYALPMFTPGFNGYFGIFDYVLFGSLALVLLLTIVILLRNKNDEGRYNDLCKLSYYRKNHNRLTKLQEENFERILELEDKHAKKIDHYYSILGSFVNSALAVAASLMVIMIIVIAVPLLEEKFVGFAELLKSFYIPSNVYKEIDTHALLMPALAGTMPLFLGFIRRKKNSWSCILSILFGVIVTVLFSIIL